MNQMLRHLLENQGYGFAGSHSAVKICTWTKKSLKDKDICYKERFYGIQSHLCCQMSPSVGFCQNQCVYCWRDLDVKHAARIGKPDVPGSIIRECVAQQRKLLSGFGGDPDVNKAKLRQAQEPKHFAISLVGEPLIYPHINQLIQELHALHKTTFVVTNGLMPNELERIELPTQLYLSIRAPNRVLHDKITNSAYQDAWQRQQRSLEVMKELQTRTVLRVTAIKGLNMVEPEGYAGLIRKAEPDFVEVKAYMFVGSSRQRLSIANMPLHSEVKSFAEQIAERAGYRVKDEKEESRVVLLSK